MNTDTIIEQSLKLLNTLTSDPIYRQFYGKEITMLFKLVSFQQYPPVVSQSTTSKNESGEK